jgi:membrane protease YdiL (CAAX protease family)
MLLAAAVICVAALLNDRTFPRDRFWRAAGLKRAGRPVARRFALGGALLTVGAALFAPQLLFSFPRQRPQLYAMVMVLYPLLSVYPQEIVFRAFFHHRYRDLFGGRTALIAASGAAFGYAHVVFENWVALALSVAGGVLFAHTYERSQSTLAVSIEHALYGCLIFTVGLGQFFYHGAVD